MDDTDPPADAPADPQAAPPADLQPDPELLDVARTAQRSTYSPYSGYAVGAAIRSASGAVFAGCNVENAAFPEGVCAEAGAISAMVLGGEREIVEIVVVTDGDEPGTPCGGCRQRLREFAGPATLVHSTTSSGASVSMTVEALLPHGFGPERLPGAST